MDFFSLGISILFKTYLLVSSLMYLMDLKLLISHHQVSRYFSYIHIKIILKLILFLLQNEQEAVAVIAIASVLALAQKHFKIITPYDSQRNLIEAKLQSSELFWENKVFTVDSFQGKSLYIFSKT